MTDQIVRAMTGDGFVKAVAITSTGIVERARQIHKTLPTATAALGRVLSAVSMMGNMQKTEEGSVTLQFKGGGPLGTVLAVSDWQGRASCRIPRSAFWRSTAASWMWALPWVRTVC